MFALNKETPKTDTHTHTHAGKQPPSWRHCALCCSAPKSKLPISGNDAGYPNKKKKHRAESRRCEASRVESCRADELGKMAEAQAEEEAQAEAVTQAEAVPRVWSLHFFSHFLLFFLLLLIPLYIAFFPGTAGRQVSAYFRHARAASWPGQGSGQAGEGDESPTRMRVSKQK